MGNDWKAEHVEPSAILPPASKSIARYNDVNDLNRAQNSAPGFHRRLLDAMKASGKVRSPHEEDFQQERVTIHRDPRATRIERGSEVRDTKTGRKGIVIRANAGYTKKSHTPVHEIADRNGNSWLQKTKHLKLLG
jgi:hypothetical protein